MADAETIAALEVAAAAASRGDADGEGDAESSGEEEESSGEEEESSGDEQGKTDEEGSKADAASSEAASSDLEQLTMATEAELRRMLEDPDKAFARYVDATAVLPDVVREIHENRAKVRILEQRLVALMGVKVDGSMQTVDMRPLTMPRATQTEVIRRKRADK